MSEDPAANYVETAVRSPRSLLDAQGFWSPRGSQDWTLPVLLKRLRLMRGLTQGQLARQAGVAQSHVSKAESGVDVRASTIARLIEALGCRLVLRVRPVVPFEVR